MATTVVSNFDNIASGAVPTAAATGFDSIFIAGTAVGDTALKYQGAASIDGSGSAYFTRLPVNMTRVYDAFYFYPENSPSVITGLVEARSTGPAGAVAFQVQMTTGRTLRIRDSAQTAVATGTAVLPLNQWSRIEVGANNGAIEVRIYAGTVAVESSTPTETLTGAYAQTDIDWLSIGQINTATFDWHLDLVRTNPDTWVGPLVTAVTLAGSAATQADTATIKVTDPTNGTAPFTHVITQLSGPATTARAVGTTGRWWAVERQTEATTWRVTTTDAAGSTALVRDITVEPPSTGGSTVFYGTSTGWVEV